MASKRWCFTINNPTPDCFKYLTALGELEEDLEYILLGREIGESGTPHIQGYIELPRARRMLGVKKLLNTNAHLEACKGSQDDNIKYCKKDGNWVEYGTPTTGHQGKRSDLDAMVEAIQNGASHEDILIQYASCAATHMRYMETLIAAIAKKQSTEFRHVEVVVLYGGAGTGKTSYVTKNNQDVFFVNPSESFPFDGYDREKTICLDDFYGDIKYSYLLRILDGHQLRIPIKGSHRFARWTKVFITSNKHPSEWYSKGLTDALKRRITKLITFNTNVTLDEIEQVDFTTQTNTYTEDNIFIQ